MLKLSINKVKKYHFFYIFIIMRKYRIVNSILRNYRTIGEQKCMNELCYSVKKKR